MEKEPWEIIQSEWSDGHIKSPAMHMEHVRRAISAGKDVPARVLAEYPTLIREANNMQFTMAYIEAALWSSCDDSGDPLDKNYGIDDFAPATLRGMLVDASKFEAKYSGLIAGSPAKAGHDFWLTRNGHGAGFWGGDWPDDIGAALSAACRAYSPFDLYIGDDGRIHNG